MLIMELVVVVVVVLRGLLLVCRSYVAWVWGRGPVSGEGLTAQVLSL